MADWRICDPCKGGNHGGCVARETATDCCCAEVGVKERLATALTALVTECIVSISEDEVDTKAPSHDAVIAALEVLGDVT